MQRRDQQMSRPYRRIRPRPVEGFFDWWWVVEELQKMAMTPYFTAGPPGVLSRPSFNHWESSGPRQSALDKFKDSFGRLRHGKSWFHRTELGERSRGPWSAQK